MRARSLAAVSLILGLGALPKGALAQAPVGVAFASDLSGRYRLEHIQIIADGLPVYDASMPPPRPVWLAQGHHTVTVSVEYRLHDALLPYMDKYGIRLESTHPVEAGREQLLFVATAVPSGGPTTPLSESARIVWRRIVP